MALTSQQRYSGLKTLPLPSSRPLRISCVSLGNLFEEGSQSRA